MTDEAGLILEAVNGRWQIRDPDQPKLLPVSVDFLTRDYQHRLKEPKSAQLLYRAINAKDAESVFDATAGFGNDSFMMASWGFKVTACERNTMIFKILGDGVSRLSEAAKTDSKLSAIVANLTIMNADSRSAVALNPSDVVYLDPMYPDLKGSALPKKEMQLLRKLFLDVDPEKETKEILERALQTAKKRVVLKRPPAAPTLVKPSHVLEGKAVRYDIYAINPK